MEQLGTAASAVRLSAQTVAKQRDHHPDLADADYAVIPELLANPTVVPDAAPRHVLLLRRSGKIFVGVVKVTGRRHENYLVSLRLTKGKSLAQLLRRHRIIAGEAGDLEK